MTELATQLALVLGILGTLAVGPGLAIVLLLQRKRKRRAQRAAPPSG